EIFIEEMKQLRLNHLRKQQNKNIDLIPVGDFTFYDHMLDMSTMLGLVPDRYLYTGGEVSLSTYYAMARGNDKAPACEMTKWFNTNYHYIVPEIGDMEPVLTENRPLKAYREARDELGIYGKPVIVGPFTFLKLAKGYTSAEFADKLQLLTKLYIQLLQELQEEGVLWVQFDEPCLVTTLTAEEMSVVSAVYKLLQEAAPGIHLILQTYFDSVDFYPEVVQIPVHAIGLDFVHGKANVEALADHGYPKDKWLFAGVIDGRNIWKADLKQKLKLLNALVKIVPHNRLILQPSCSLLHVPVSLAKEIKLDPLLKNAMSYADEKLDELLLLNTAVRAGYSNKLEDWTNLQLRTNADALAQLKESPYRKKSAEIATAAEHSLKRNLPFEERQIMQKEKWALPLLPTTTIGSFPQSAEVRQARQLWRKGEWSKEQYTLFIREQIKKWIGIQEDIGLDVLVHGEFERTDMVEFFGEKLAGFAFTQNGWVQSYGSRCVKPPVIYGDVSFVEPMTVEETVYAQSLTPKPVKGMLTGPITILNWSFVRDDITRQAAAYQIAIALRKEVEALEAAGIGMIQVDEPALREGLPLKESQRDHYLNWAVDAFRISTSTVKDTTQIHTHMCYCEFHDIIDSIRDLDADVISIETSRSHGELVASFETHTYEKGIGLGVYDIHSPRVPEVDEMLGMIHRALQVLPAGLFWVNPDCGLKTRGTEETLASLKTMVHAAHTARAELV
ncbi:MAG TPA: 5-methyltetrahydropteroyltriglutamate--homocysteine S-methyltransferase, partial [Bacilli bacterium]